MEKLTKEEKKLMAIIRWYDYYNEWENIDDECEWTMELKIDCILNSDEMERAKFFLNVYDELELATTLIDINLEKIKDDEVRKNMDDIMMFVNHEAYGRAYVNSSNGIFTKYGFIEFE